MTDLEKLTLELGKGYDAFKKAKQIFEGDSKTKKNREIGLKEKFLNEATQATMATLGQKTFKAPKTLDRSGARTEAERRNPGWLAKDDIIYPDGWHILLEEDPTYKPFSYINRIDERVWTKQVVSTSATLDDEKLRAENPELWERITEPTRVVKDLATLNSDDLAAVQEYIYPGPLQVKLAAPRKAKAEELE